MEGTGGKQIEGAAMGGIGKPYEVASTMSDGFEKAMHLGHQSIYTREGYLLQGSLQTLESL